MKTVCHLVPGPTYTVRHKSVLPSTTLYLVIIRGRVAEMACVCRWSLCACHYHPTPSKTHHLHVEMAEPLFMRVKGG